MNDQSHLFDDDTEPAVHVDRRIDHRLPPSERVNPMVTLHGLGPIGRKCGDCVSLVWKGGHGSHRYYGCELRGKFTNGPATDHLVRWQACKRFVE